MSPKAVFDEILEAVTTLLRGERDVARPQLESLWRRLATDADGAEILAFDRAVVAHYLADAQDDPAQELEWDIRALESTIGAPPGLERSIGGAVVTLASFLPSLHLNLAADYERIGDLVSAREHAGRAAEHVAALPDDSPLAAMTRAGIERIRRRVG